MNAKTLLAILIQEQKRWVDNAKAQNKEKEELEKKLIAKGWTLPNR